MMSLIYSSATLLITCLTVVPNVHGCGPVLPGQERTLRFNVTGFTLPVAMAYTTDATVPSQVPLISRSSQEAEATVRQLIRQSIEDVLYKQGHGAGLSDDVISLILQQLTVTVNYTPLQCNKVFTMPAANNMYDGMKLMNCLVTDSTVTKVCIPPPAAANPPVPMCNTANIANLQRVPHEYLSVSGSLRTTNVIMANWSEGMWQSVMNRVVGSLASTSFASNFRGAYVILS